MKIFIFSADDEDMRDFFGNAEACHVELLVDNKI